MSRLQTNDEHYPGQYQMTPLMLTRCALFMHIPRLCITIDKLDGAIIYFHLPKQYFAKEYHHALHGRPNPGNPQYNNSGVALT